MEDSRFLFLFDFKKETYALMWDTCHKFAYLMRQSDGKTTDGFGINGLKSFTQLRKFKDKVVGQCENLLDQDNYFLFQ